MRSCRNPAFEESAVILAATRIGTGTASRASSAAEFDAAIEFKAVHVKIDLYGLDTVQEIFVYDVLETFNIKGPILIGGLIQSHGQAGTASPAFV